VTQIVPLDVADDSAGAALDRRIPLTLLDMNQDFCTSTNEPPTPDGQPLLSLIKKTAYNAELNEDHVHSSAAERGPGQDLWYYDFCVFGVAAMSRGSLPGLFW
jgi:hypothetical protein